MTWGTYLILSALLLYWWLVNRKRWFVLVVVTALTAATVLIDAIWLLVDRPLVEAGQRYDWSDWYVLPVVVPVGAALLLCGAGLVKVVTGFVRGFWLGVRGK